MDCLILGNVAEKNENLFHIEDAIRSNIADKFKDTIAEIFLSDEKEWACRFSFKDFTSNARAHLIQFIPSFVDREFGNDLLSQSLPVLSAGLRVIYMMKEKDHRNTKSVKNMNKIRKRDVVSTLEKVVDDYIVDAVDGVEVIQRIIRKKQDELVSHFSL